MAPRTLFEIVEEVYDIIHYENSSTPKEKGVALENIVRRDTVNDFNTTDLD